MKWFTDDWSRGRLEDAEYDAVVADYQQHVRKIRQSLPVGLQRLAEAGGPVSLHDGHFILTTARVDASDLQLDIATHDWTGSRVPPGAIAPLLHVHLVYRDYELVEPSADQLYWRARDPKIEILYGEVDVLDEGRFEHRLSTWPEHVSIIIRFKTVDVVVVRFINGSAEILDSAPPS